MLIATAVWRCGSEFTPASESMSSRRCIRSKRAEGRTEHANKQQDQREWAVCKQSPRRRRRLPIVDHQEDGPANEENEDEVQREYEEHEWRGNELPRRSVVAQAPPSHP